MLPMAFKFERALQAQGKALGAMPAFQDRLTPVATYQPGAVPPRKGSVISQREAARHLDAYGGGQAIDWVYDCVNLYADATSTADYKLQKPDGTTLVRVRTDGTPSEHEVGPQALYDLLDKPNPFMLYDEMVALLVIDLLLVGNAYWFKWRNDAEGHPAALYRMSPMHVKIKPGPYGPQSYEYQPPGIDRKMVIQTQDMIHFRRPNPHSAYYGMGVIQGSGRAMDLELSVTDTSASYYENRADPSLIVQSERRIPRDVFNKLRAQLRARASGSSKAGELLVLEAGLQASTLTPNASQSLIDVAARSSRDRIYAKFRASPRLFGIQDESVASDKISDVRRDFDNNALRPFMTKISRKLSQELAAAFEVEYEIDYTSTLPADDAIKVAQTVATMPGVKIREVRGTLSQFDIPESTGDKKIDDMVINDPTLDMDNAGQVTDPATGKKIANQGADRPIGSEAGRPPKGKNTRAIAAGKSLPELMAILEGKAMLASSTPAAENRLAAETQPDDPYSAARAADVADVTRYVEEQLKLATTALERALLDEVEGKALKTSNLAQRVRNHPAWKEFRKKVALILTDGARRAATSGVVHSGLHPDDEIDYDEVASVVVNRQGGLNGIVKTLKDKVSAGVKDARVADGERHDYTSAIQTTIADWKGTNAGLIAETEAVHAYNEATLQVAEAAGITHVFVTDGDDDDQPCIDAHGSTWTIDEARDNRLEHPRCHRAFLPVAA